MTKITKGSCECGAVQYELSGPLRPSIGCHCTQCRKISGHYWSATQVQNDCFKITQDNALVWYQSSDPARRGHCKVCGSSMFWQHDKEEATSVATGTIDGATGLKTAQHIFVADKGDYYDLNDGLPQREQSSCGMSF